MENINNPKSNKEILKGLVISEEDTRAQLEELVTKTKRLFQIDEKSKKIVFSQEFRLTNSEKILLYLIGKYFSKELNLIQDDKFKIGDISNDLADKVTTLSRPLGEACSKGLADKKGEFYYINHYRIREIVDSITKKYESKKGKTEKEHERKAGKKPTQKKKKLDSEPQKITITVDTKGIEELAKDLGIEQERIRELFEFEEQGIHILEALKGTTESKTQFSTALAYLTTYYYYFREQEIESSKLYRIMEDLGIGALGHLYSNLCKNRKLLIPKKANKKINTYRITTPGIKKGVSLLSEYFSNK